MGSIEEVEEAGTGTDVLLEDVDPLVGEHPADVRVRIVEVPEDAGAGGTGLEAGRHPTVAGAVQAEGALLHDALRADAVGEVALVGVDLLGGDDRLLPVESACVVGAGRFAVPAADAPAPPTAADICKGKFSTKNFSATDGCAIAL